MFVVVAVVANKIIIIIIIIWNKIDKMRGWILLTLTGPQKTGAVGWPEPSDHFV